MPDKSYGAAIAAGRKTVNAARLADPDEHFPYRLADAKQAIGQNMSPDPSDKSLDVTGADVMTERIATASGVYVAAQAAYLEDPTRQRAELYEQARDDLTAARRAHRRHRAGPDGDPKTGGAIIGLTTAPVPDSQRGPRARRSGEE